MGVRSPHADLDVESLSAGHEESGTGTGTGAGAGGAEPEEQPLGRRGRKGQNNKRL